MDNIHQYYLDPFERLFFLSHCNLLVNPSPIWTQFQSVMESHCKFFGIFIFILFYFFCRGLKTWNTCPSRTFCKFFGVLGGLRTKGPYNTIMKGMYNVLLEHWHIKDPLPQWCTMVQFVAWQVQHFTVK
jgi:hypothetical protein